ncbi:MAG: S8 family serine peptidase [Candidatus Accumulibacter sp.]|jgi:outer membrane autotransporter protein|nr:S8 family serine peptidase [Accumulibacter sp.]
MSAFLDFPQISVINNSWGYPVFPTDFISPSPELVRTMRDAADMFRFLGRLTAGRDALFVFAAGNEGRSSPGLPANLPSLILGATMAGGRLATPYDFPYLSGEERRALSLNIISVSAFDPWAANSGSLAFAAGFSNMADGATDYTLMAPGVDILSSVHAERGLYDDTSGTSMATPMVSGAAALVKEAFPFMGGKQLADVLLSTATPITERPPFLVPLRMLFDPDTWQPTFEGVHNVIAPDTLDAASIAAMLDDPALRKEITRMAATRGYMDPVDGYVYVDGFISDAVNWLVLFYPPSDDPSQTGPFFLIPEDAYNKLFGMGVVNAYRAVRGPGWLDAHRLNNADKKNYGGTDYALYPVDTKGYNGVWSNDVAQVKVGDARYPGYDFGPSYPDPENNEFFGGLNGLDVGLFKSGKGTLSLAGDNSYRGPTVVAGGELSLGVAGQADKTAKLAGDVYVEQVGTFSGNGLVRGNLDFKGRLSPGLPSAPGSALTVEGNVGGGGELFSRIWADGRANRLAGDAIDLDGVRLSLSDLPGGGALPARSYRLVESRNNALGGTSANDSATVRQGVTLLHDFSFRFAADALYAELVKSAAAPEAKALSEGYLSGLIFANQGADFAAGKGVSDAVQAAKAGLGRGAFTAISGGSNHYKTGSRVDVDGFSLITGLSWGKDLAAGRLTLGGFFEYGNGNYDARGSFSNAGRVHGKGDLKQYGVGVLGRMDYAGADAENWYAEASLRAGKIDNDYGSSDLRDSQGRKAEYNATSTYYGFHIGTGHVWNITDKAVLDLYGKYFRTRRKGDSVRLSTGDPVKFKSADSSRLRFGGRFTYAVNEHVFPYIGAAWEHEFDGKTRSTTNGHDIGAPSLRGDTGMGELGLTLKSSTTLPLSLDLGVRGHVGKREGVTGLLQIKYEF